MKIILLLVLCDAYYNINLQVKFVLACQDTESGGFSDRPGDVADPFHTLFGLTALSLLNTDYPLKKINPTYCMPEYVIQRLHLKPARLDQSN